MQHDKCQVLLKAPPTIFLANVTHTHETCVSESDFMCPNSTATPLKVTTWILIMLQIMTKTARMVVDDLPAAERQILDCRPPANTRETFQKRSKMKKKRATVKREDRKQGTGIQILTRTKYQMKRVAEAVALITQMTMRMALIQTVHCHHTHDLGRHHPLQKRGFGQRLVQPAHPPRQVCRD